jgi:hypothetical protein
MRSATIDKVIAYNLELLLVINNCINLDYKVSKMIKYRNNQNVLLFDENVKGI